MPTTNRSGQPTARPRRAHTGSFWIVASLLTALVLGVMAFPTLSSAAAAPTTGWVRFAHFAPSEGPVDIWVDGSVVVHDSSFKDVGSYISLPVGSYSVAVRPTGAPASTAAIAAGTAVVNSSTAITAAIVQVNGALQLEMLNDDLTAPPAGDAKVRIIQSAPEEGTLSATIQPDAAPASATETKTATQGGDVAIPDVAFASASPYTDVPAGTYQVMVDRPGKTTALVMGSELPAAAGTVESVVVLGASSGPTLEVVSDAVGSSTMPVGGMETGFGGTAGPPPPPGLLAPMTAASVIGGLAVVLFLFRRRLPIGAAAQDRSA